MSDRIQHWTRAGVFSMERVNKLGVVIWELRFADTLLSTYPDPIVGAVDIADGVFDARLPEPASSLGVPYDYKDWNMLR